MIYLPSKLLILLKKKENCYESAQTDVLKNILPLNSILSKFSELDIKTQNPTKQTTKKVLKNSISQKKPFGWATLTPQQ